MANIDQSALRHIVIFDTTLRDGEQSPGASMNLAEKMELAQALVGQHGGRLPDELDTLVTLPGIGRAPSSVTTRTCDEVCARSLMTFVMLSEIAGTSDAVLI